MKPEQWPTADEVIAGWNWQSEFADEARSNLAELRETAEILQRAKDMFSGQGD